MNQPPAPMSHVASGVLCGRALADVINERVEQIDAHGFTPAHDALHHPGELALGAASYLNTAIEQLHNRAFGPEPDANTWPWSREAWRPGDARANLIKAVAIGWAVIDRLDAGQEAAIDAVCADILATPLARRTEV